MHYKSILVPFDDSSHAQKALREAVGIAQGNDDVVVHVIEVTAPPQDLVYNSINQTGFGMGVSAVEAKDFAAMVAQRNAADDAELQHTIAPYIEGYTGQITAEVVFGVYTTETILSSVKHYECDLIVMGSRGLGAIRGAIGSISYGVLREAEIPVLIVK